jgi:hypothetical protein
VLQSAQTTLRYGRGTATTHASNPIIASPSRTPENRNPEQIQITTICNCSTRVAGAHLRLDRLGNAIFQHRHRTLHIRFGSLYVIRRGRGHVRVSQNPAYGPSAWEVAPRLLAEFRGH